MSEDSVNYAASASYAGTRNTVTHANATVVGFGLESKRRDSLLVDVVYQTIPLEDGTFLALPHADQYPLPQGGIYVGAQTFRKSLPEGRGNTRELAILDAKIGLCQLMMSGLTESFGRLSVSPEST